MDGEIVDLLAFGPGPDAGLLARLGQVLGLEEGLELAVGGEDQRFDRCDHLGFQLRQVVGREHGRLGLLGLCDRAVQRTLLRDQRVSRRTRTRTTRTVGKDDGINGRSARMHLFEVCTSSGSLLKSFFYPLTTATLVVVMCCTLQTLSSLVCRIAETLEPRETALQVKNSFDFYKYHYHYHHQYHHHALSVLSLGCDRKNGTAETMDMGMIMQAILKNGVGNTAHTTHRTHRTHTV